MNLASLLFSIIVIQFTLVSVRLKTECQLRMIHAYGADCVQFASNAIFFHNKCGLHGFGHATRNHGRYA